MNFVAPLLDFLRPVFIEIYHHVQNAAGHLPNLGQLVVEQLNHELDNLRLVHDDLARVSEQQQPGLTTLHSYL